MNAREYLSQVKRLKHVIDNRQQELKRLETEAMSIGGIDYGKDRVQTGPTSAVENNVLRICQMQDELYRLNLKAYETIHRITGEINSLQDSRYVRILFKRYIEDKSMRTIADETHYQEDYVRALHTRALKAFERTHKISNLIVL